MKPKTLPLIGLVACCLALWFTWPDGGSLPFVPTDALTATVVAEYAKEVSPEKAAQVQALAGVYRKAPAITSDAGISTTADLYKALKLEANNALEPEDLPLVRAVLASEINSKLPTASTATFDRVEAAKQFKRCQTALEACK